MHLAIDTRSGRVCAVKIVDVDERAHRELELMQYINRIGQEHFVKLLGFFGTSGSQPAARKLCMVFPWYDINLHGLWHARSGIFPTLRPWTWQETFSRDWCTCMT